MQKTCVVLLVSSLCLSFVTGCGGEGYIGYDDGKKQTEIRAGVYRSERVERPDGSKESVDIIGPHVEVRTLTEGAHGSAGTKSP